MNRGSARWRGWPWWLVPVLTLAVLLGIETDFGQSPHRLPGPLPIVEPTSVAAALLPEYRIEGGLPAHSETVNRTLFNATRRPAPALPSEGGRRQMQRGQYVLTGTAVAGERHLAFLKELAGGKSRVVRQGEQINGVLVADVKADRVRLTLGDESEELVLKVAAGPKTTIQPAAAQPPPPGGAPSLGGQAVQGNVPAAEAAPLSVPERRRAAAAAASGTAVPPAPTPAAAAGAGAQPAAAPAATPATPGPPASTDPSWNEVYERMRQRTTPTQPGK